MYDDLLDVLTKPKSKFLMWVISEADIAGKSRASLGGQFRVRFPNQKTKFNQISTNSKVSWR